MKTILLFFLLYSSYSYAQDFSSRAIEICNKDLKNEIESYVQVTNKSIQKTNVFEDFIVFVEYYRYLSSESFVLSALLKREDVFEVHPEFYSQINGKTILFSGGLNKFCPTDSVFCRYLYDNYTLNLKDLSKYKAEAIKEMDKKLLNQPDTIFLTNYKGEKEVIIKSKLEPTIFDPMWNFESLGQLRWEIIFNNGVFIEKRGIKNLSKTIIPQNVWKNKEEFKKSLKDDYRE